MAKFGKLELTDEVLNEAVDKLLKPGVRRNPSAVMNQIDKEAKKQGATNTQRRAAMRMLQKRFNAATKEAKAGFDKASADLKSGNRGDLKKSLTPEKIEAAKKSFSGAMASVMDSIMNPEPSQEGKPYGGSKELKKATTKAIRTGGEAREYARKKKAGGGKVYAMNRRMGGPIRKPRMK